jgi:hypothetical protein
MTSMLATISEQFTTASLAGTYALVGIGRGGQTPIASVGIFTFDGQGHVSGSAIANVAGTAFNERLLVKTAFSGTYTVDENGSGYGSTAMLATASDGSSRNIQTTLLITQAESIGSGKIAQEFSLMQQTVEPISGSLMMYSATRHPDGGKFSLASFQGTYGGPGIARGNQTPAIAIGIGAVHFDGKGGFTGVDVQNLPADLFQERRIATFDTAHAKYTVNEDGTGTIVGDNNSQAQLVITKARVVDGIKVGLEYFFVTNDLLPSTGNLVTTFITKRLP